MAISAVTAYGPRRTSNYVDIIARELAGQSGLNNYRLVHDTFVTLRPLAASVDPIWPNFTQGGSGTYAIDVSASGGVATFSTGATAGSNIGIYGSASWVSAINTQRWGCAFTFSVSTAAQADTVIVAGMVNLSFNRIAGIGCIGAKSTTKFSTFCGTHQAVYSAAHATASTVTWDTGDHVGYMVSDGTTLYSKFDSEPWYTQALNTFTGAANGIIILRNEGTASSSSISIDDAIYVLPGK